MDKEILVLGYIDKGTGIHQSNLVISPKGLLPNICSSDFKCPCKVLVHKKEKSKVIKKKYGTIHFPHGWLGFNYDFSGICPTIDRGICFQHTLLIEVNNGTDSIDRWITGTSGDKE